MWKIHSPRYPKNTFPEVLHIRLSFLHLMSNGLNEVINSLTQIVTFYKVLCSIFSKGTQPFDFIKPNFIWKLT